MNARSVFKKSSFLHLFVLCSAAFCVLFSVVGVSSCGRVGRVSGKELHEFDKDSLPTLENFSSWQSKWDKNGWIVTFADSPELASNAAFTAKNAAIRSLLSTGGLQEETEAFQSVGSFLNTHLSVELIRMNHFWDEIKQDDPGLGFYYVKLNNPDEIWDQISPSVDLPIELWSGDRLQAMAAWQSQSLSKLEGAQWVEPNLMSTLSNAGATAVANAAPQPQAAWTPPPEFRTSAPIVEVLKRIKADQAYKFASESGLLQSDVTVAVLDTGVDFLHPDLKDQMAINPNEIAGDKQDNDNNCHIDDIFGIDATVECSNDTTALPHPGPADLGGAGVACPEEREGDDLSHNCGHGSHVAGIIAAKHGGQLNTIGVCPRCKILSLRVSERCLQPDTDAKKECVKVKAPLDKKTQYEVDGGIADSSQIRALSYIFKLRRPAPLSSQLVVNVVNMSLGKYFRSRAMSYIIRNLDKKGVIVVAAAGNDNTDSPSYPAAYAPVVSVCATGEEEYHRGQFGKAIFSNFGDWVDICAPGVDIESTIPGTRGDFSGQKRGLTTRKDGTSQATPFVAGAAGYMLSVSGDKRSAKQIIREIKEAANYDDLYNTPFNKGFYEACYPDKSSCDALLGSGMLDLFNAVKSIKKSRISETDPRAVTSGCIVSTIGQGLPFFGWHFYTGMPFVLANFWLVLKFMGLMKNFGQTSNLSKSRQNRNRKEKS